jgi:trimethylamine:corrinoid methyltransferase-like protein
VRQTWQDKGAQDAAARAHQRVEQVIAAYQPKPHDPGLLHELEAITLNAAKGEGLERLPALPPL